MQIWTFEKLGPIHIIQKFITMFWLKHFNFETIFFESKHVFFFFSYISNFKSIHNILNKNHIEIGFEFNGSAKWGDNPYLHTSKVH